MAKPEPMVSAKARPVNLVLRSPWTARENPPQDLGHPVNPVNVDAGQGGQTRKRKLVRTQSPEVERSQVTRQENSQKSHATKQGDQEESSNSGSTRRLVRAATPRTEFHNMRYANHQYMTKVFHFLTKEVGNYSRILNMFNGSIKDKCVDMRNVHVFVNESSHSSWTKTFGEVGSLQEHELREISELIQHHTEIDTGAF